MGDDLDRRLCDFAQAAPVAIWMTDVAGKVTFVNKVLSDFVGSAESDVFARVHPDDRAELDAAVTAALCGQKPLGAETRWRRADGQWIWFRCEGAAQHDASGALLGLCACNIDINDAHRLKQMLRDDIPKLERQARAKRPTHAFNNIITVLISGLRVLEGEGDAARRALIIESMRKTLEKAGIDAKRGDVSASVSAQPGRRILVVEDGDAVAGVACGMLEKLQCKPLRVGSAEAALDVLQREQDFALVFSDVFLPGMTGIELAEKIERTWPALPVLLTSGFSGRDLSPPQPLLPKPYGLEELAQAIDGAMSGRTDQAVD